MANLAELVGEPRGAHGERRLEEIPPEGTAYARIREVLRDSGPGMVFQPIVDLKVGRPAGFESLARFAGDPPRPPNIWFDEARSVGLHQQLELAAITNALAILETFPKRKYISVNVSPDVACSNELASLISGFPTDRIVLEITERAAVDDYGALQRAVGRLRDRGVRFAIDDIGAGFANMSHVLHLRPEILKLDRGFTTGIDRDREKRALVTSMVQFAESVGAMMVAEGIETAEEAEALAASGIGWGQGYYLARPAPPSSKLWQLSVQPISIATSHAADIANAASKPKKGKRIRWRLTVVAAALLLSLGLTAVLVKNWPEDSIPKSITPQTRVGESSTEESTAAPVESARETNSVEEVAATSIAIASEPTTSSPTNQDPIETSSEDSPTAPAESSTLAALSVDTEVIGGSSAKGMVSLTSPAPAGGITISLLSSDPAVASVPASVTVPEGASNASFDIATAIVLETKRVVISAVHDSVKKSETLTVSPATRLL